MTTLLRRAESYAIAAHGEQKYGNEFPYSLHLRAVESVLRRFGIEDEELLATAWLHDVLEDTNRTYEDLVTFFGSTVANIVATVTEPKGGNRAWRHSMTYPHIREFREALILKLADRIANIEAGGKLVGMYRKEYAIFKNYLYYDALSPVPEMWQHLDDLLVEVPTYG